MRKKLILCTVALLLVLSFSATTAFADFDEYKGRCINQFTTEDALTKINDTWFSHWNYYTVTDGYDGDDHTWQYSMILSDSVVMLEGPLQSGREMYGQDPYRLYPGQVRVRIKNNYEPGRYIYTEGCMELWP